MLVRQLARGNGRPDHGGKHGLEGGQVAHNPSIDKPFQVGQRAVIQEGRDEAPVSAVPAQQEDLFDGVSCVIHHEKTPLGRTQGRMI